LSYTLTFECVGQCSWESLESSQKRFGGAMHRREPSAVSSICSRAVAGSEPDVLVTHLAIERAGDYDLIGRPWCTTAWFGSQPGSSMGLLSSVCRRTTGQHLVYPHSFTRVDTSKRSAPHHCALQMYSIARNFTHQARI